MAEPRCTLFLTGLPEDVKERELRNVFRFYSGFVGCKLVESKVEKSEKVSDSPPPRHMGFCLFNSEAAATEVKECLDGTYFDYTDTRSVALRISFAKKNLVVRQSQFQEGARLNQRGLAAAAQLYYGNSSDPYANPATATPSYPTSQDPYSTDPYGTGTVAVAAAAATTYDQNPYGQSSYPARAGTKRKGPTPVGAPSTTLYVSNLAETVYPEEIKQIFQTQPGFEEISTAKAKGRVFAFVLFSCQEEATTALSTLQGHELQSMPGQGGMRVSYSKTPFRPASKRSKTDGAPTQAF